MSTKTLQYANYLSSLKKGGKPCYQSVPKALVEFGRDEIATRIASLSGYTVHMVLCIIDVLQAVIAEAFRQGLRIDLGQIRGGVAIHGSARSAKESFAQSGMKLVPYLSVTGDLAHCLDGVRAENVTAAVTVIIDSVLDIVHSILNVLIGTTGVNVQVSGLGLKIVTGEEAVEGTGVWIEDKDGRVASVGTVTHSTSTTLDCVIDLPEPGEWYFVVASNGGQGADLGVSIARRKVTVKATAEEEGGAS